MHIPWDEVTVVLSARRDIVSETVRVDAGVTVSLTGDDAAQFREIVRNALGKALDGEWGFKSVSRKEEGSGMEQMRIIATTRVPEHRTAGLVERLRTASRPGLRLELKDIQYRPPRSEIKKAAAELRQEIYRSAQTEADRLNELLPADSIPWRVGRIDAPVEETGDTKAISQARLSAYLLKSHGEGGAPEDEPDFMASLRVEVIAKVTLRRLALPLPPTAFFRAGARAED